MYGWYSFTQATQYNMCVSYELDGDISEEAMKRFHFPFNRRVILTEVTNELINPNLHKDTFFVGKLKPNTWRDERRKYLWMILIRRLA